MATAEDLWGARSADARMLSDLILSQAPSPKPKKTKSVDLGGLSSSFSELDDINKQEWYETPVVKGILDALSVGAYVSAANANATVQSVRAGKDEFEKSGNVGSAIGEYLGTGLDQAVNHNPAVMGIKAGIGGDKDSARLYHDVIKNAQSVGLGEEYANSAEAETIQGIGGFAGDVLLDPTTYLGIGAVGHIASGAIGGGIKGAKAAKDVAKGGDALDRTVGRVAGIKQGAKDGLQAYRTEKADDLALRIAKRDINLRGADPSLYKESIPGFAHLPEDVIAGTAKLSGRDIKKAGKTAKVSAKAAEKETATEIQKLADTEELTYVQTPEDLARETVKANNDFYSGKISVHKHNAIIRTLKGTAKTFGHNYDEAVESFLVSNGLKAPTEAKAEIPTEVIPLNKPETADIGKEISPEKAAKATLANPESLTPAHNYVDDPGQMNPAQFIQDTPVDQFVKGTAHLTTDVPRMNKKTRESLRKFLTENPAAKKTIKSEAVYNGLEIQKFLASGSLRESRVNPEKVITSLRGRLRTPSGNVASLSRFYTRTELVELIDKVKKTNDPATRRLIAEGKSDEAFALINEKISKVLKDKIYVEDLEKLVQTVKGGTISPEVVEFAWEGAKPSPKQLRDLGFKGDLQEAMRTIREFGSNLDKIARKSGAFRDILDAYRNGRLPVEDMARFEEFASTFFKLEGADRLNKDRILEMATDFLSKNSDAIVASSILHAPMAGSGRLSNLAGGSATEGKNLLRILSPDSAEMYSRPFRETERIAMVEAMAQKAEADILNGISPDFVAKAADDILDKHFTEYATKSGDMVTRDGWHTSTMNLNDGLPKKEFFWTTHSAIDLFSKLNASVGTFMKNIPELDAIRSLRYSKPTAANIKQYQIAVRGVKDNLAMRILAQVDVNLKAHNVFGYLTNTMPDGDTAIRLSMYDVLNAMGPELRQKHLWTEKGDINNFRPTQIMDVAETLIRTLKGAEVAGEIDYALMLKNAQEIMKGKFSKNSDAAGIVRFIESNLDESIKGFNAGIVAEASKTIKKADVIRRTKYTQFINNMINKVDADGLTPLQKLADTVLRNTALHGSQFNSKIVYATEEQMKRLTQALEYGTVGTFADVVTSVVRPDKFEPEVSAVFAQEIRNTKLEFVSPDELAFAEAKADVAKLSTGKEIVLYTGKEMAPELKKVSPNDYYGPQAEAFATNTKPKPLSHTMRLSSKSANEIMLNGRRLLTDGKTVSTKWPTKPWRSKTAHELQQQINKANAVAAGKTGNANLHPDVIFESAAKFEDEALVNMARQELAHDSVRNMFIGQRMFNVRFGKEISYDVVTSGTHLGTALETAFHGMMNEYSRKYPIEVARQALKDLQATSPEFMERILKGNVQGIEPAVVDMARMTGAIFDSSHNNFYVRNGVGPELMNSILDNTTHVPWRFPTAVDGELITPAQMGEVWKTWTNIENPYKAFSAIHTAMVKASSDISMASRYSNKFGRADIPVGEEGKWAKINVDGIKNKFVDLIDTSLYYPKEIISELPEWGKFIVAERTFKNEKFQQWVNSYDEITSALKLTQTVMKPGHHVMSIQGDFFRNRLAGVKGVQPFKDSWRVIRSRNAADKGFSELDKYARIKAGSLNIEVESKLGGAGTRLTIGGNRIILDDSQMYDLFTQRGIFLPPHNAGVAEDLLAVAHHGDFNNLPGGKVANTVTKITSKTNAAVSGLINNKVIKMNSFTSQRDNLFRGELAIDAMKSKNFKSVEEALDFAEAKVRKWAPTAKDLTAMESKYNRRVFLYYTWLRGMIPRVVEGLIMRPGIATMPSKGMYNMAIANGLDPASIGDPFDPNQLLPDYYRNGVLGPQWKDPNTGHLWGLNPTAPVIDVFNSIGAGSSIAGLNPGAEDSNYERIGRTLMGMTNPIFRSPVELAIGRNIGTDSPIQDNGQYLTDMPGPLRYASKVTGHTINPMMGGIPRRTEAKFKEGIGTPDDWWNNFALETTNFLTGSQVKDYTSDSAMKSAEYQEKEKERNEQNTDSRTDWWK